MLERNQIYSWASILTDSTGLIKTIHDVNKAKKGIKLINKEIKLVIMKLAHFVIKKTSRNVLQESN